MMCGICCLFARGSRFPQSVQNKSPMKLMLFIRASSFAISNPGQREGCEDVRQTRSQSQILRPEIFGSDRNRRDAHLPLLDCVLVWTMERLSTQSVLRHMVKPIGKRQENSKR